MLLGSLKNAIGCVSGPPKRKKSFTVLGPPKVRSFLEGYNMGAATIWRILAIYYVLPKINGFLRSFAFTRSIKKHLSSSKPYIYSGAKKGWLILDILA